MDEDENKPVGHKRPPKKHQFKKGMSGNKRGRPKGSKNKKTIVSKIAYETYTIMDNGKKRRLSTIEVVLLAIRNKAIGGDRRAFRLLNKIWSKYAQASSSGRRGFLIIPEAGTDEELEREMAESQRKYRGPTYRENERESPDV